ncbi:unnamed protein product [Mytilus coruscus]|uniref:Uncharacterized protein n=1 Tax=Mytilus coruscus TaxID=42192 RepID=A0A6J8EZX6_MYTCO|nr:unnamed protein product [Mytilus coruscus]
MMRQEKKSRLHSAGDLSCLKMKFFEKKKKNSKNRQRSASLPPDNRIEILIKEGKAVRGIFRNNSSGHIITDRRPTRVYSKPDKLSTCVGEISFHRMLLSPRENLTSVFQDQMQESSSTNSIVDKLKTALIIRQRNLHSPTPQEEEDEDTDSVGSYEEPDPQSAPPPSVPTRRGAPQAPSGPPRSASHGIPVNRRPVPQMPPEEQQPVYEETNEEDEQQVYDETMDQPVYEDPDEQPVKKPAPRRQLPVPEQTNTMGRKVPMRTTSEPDVPAPPPPRGKGRQPPKAGKKAEESSAPVPPPPRGGRRPPPEPTQEEFYEDPDNPPQTGRKTSGPQIAPPQDDFEQDDYEEPVEVSHPPSQGHKSSIRPLPKGHPHGENFEQVIECKLC